MNELQIFENSEFGSVRTVEIDGKIYFVANDVAKALGYAKPANAVAAHCKGILKTGIPSERGIQETNIIPEGDIYRLVIKSQLPTAEKFEQWVFDEVLPSIRKKKEEKHMEERKNEAIQEMTEVQDESYKSGVMQYIDSREVAEIVEKKHKNLLADITRYSKELNQLNFQPIEFFIESNYKDSVGRTQKCYLVTRKGCEFIAHKLTGIKGTKFTATYINRFQEMEDKLKEKEYEKGFQQLMERQDKLEQMILEKFNQIESNEEIPRPPITDFVEAESESEKRIKALNRLVAKMAKACGWERRFALHRLYKTLEKVLDISLDDYIEMYQADTGDMNISTLEMLVKYGRLYGTAVRLCENTINSMKC